MNSPMLPPDDRASALTPFDSLLLSELEAALNRRFYEGCDRVTQIILAQCQWSIATNQDLPILTIACPDAALYWDIVNSIENISKYLSQVCRASKIEVIPGDRKCMYFAVEISS